ncbi:MAG: M15 family metallopeptidase [Deltaproteobacteria bacterium]|nr:M15 family metallopeptidase [Deltaproteobacteria bacterium]
MFAIPYRTGAIRPVETENQDPGRVRVEAIFAATYGPRPASRQIRLRFLGIPVRVHRKIAPALERVAARLARARQRDASLAPFLRRLSGGFAARKIAGTERTSAHAYGIAIDLHTSVSDYWRWDKDKKWRNRIPQAIVDAFEAEGFIWGGRWYHYDTMHFEYRPELFGPPCREPTGSRRPLGNRGI